MRLIAADRVRSVCVVLLIAGCVCAVSCSKAPPPVAVKTVPKPAAVEKPRPAATAPPAPAEKAKSPAAVEKPAEPTPPQLERFVVLTPGGPIVVALDILIDNEPQVALAAHCAGRGG